MKQYKTDFELEVVKSFLAGEGGAKLLARRWSVPEEKIRTWVSHYRLHGVDGLHPKRSAYSSEFKLQVLSHQDREQLSSRQVAAIYDIRNPNQVVVWRLKLNQVGVESFASSKQGRSKMKPELPCPRPSNMIATDSYASGQPILTAARRSWFQIRGEMAGALASDAAATPRPDWRVELASGTARP